MKNTCMEHETLTETILGRMIIPEAYVSQFEYKFSDEIKG